MRTINARISVVTGCASRIRRQAATGSWTKSRQWGDPTDIVQLGTGNRVSAGEGQRRVALQRRVATCRVVIALEVGKFPLKITGIPEQHMVEEFPAHRSNQTLNEWV